MIVVGAAVGRVGGGFRGVGGWASAVALALAELVVVGGGGPLGCSRPRSGRVDGGGVMGRLCDLLAIAVNSYALYTLDWTQGPISDVYTRVAHAQATTNRWPAVDSRTAFLHGTLLYAWLCLRYATHPPPNLQIEQVRITA